MSKNIRKFASQAEYDAYKANDGWDYPSVSFVETDIDSQVHYNNEFIMRWSTEDKAKVPSFYGEVSHETFKSWVDSASVPCEINRADGNITPYTMDGNNPAAILKLQVHVRDSEDFSTLYRHQMGCIRLRRPEVTFLEGEKAVEKIPFVNLSGKPLKLQCDTAMLPGCLSFSVAPSVVEDRGEGEIIISFDPSKPHRPLMMVMLKDLGVSPSKASIKVNVNKE
jgi:hypothetical protein